MYYNDENKNNLTIITDSDYQILPDISKKLIQKKVKVGDKIKLQFDLKEILKQKDKNNVEFMIEILSIEKVHKFEITKEFLEKSSNTKSWIKYLKRYLYLFFKWQHSLEVFQISEEHAHILWINFSAPSLGDSLMDLSSRVMLSDRKIDLFTHRNNVQIFKNDSFFFDVIN